MGWGSAARAEQGGADAHQGGAFGLAREHAHDHADKDESCSVCGAPDTRNPCSICSDGSRDNGLICVVEEAGALWAMERSGAFRGKYHVLGGLLSALDGVGPDALRVAELVGRVRGGEAKEVVLALPATVDGQTTAHYIAERLAGSGVEITSLARGVPVGGELDYLDEGTLTAALKSRTTTFWPKVLETWVNSDTSLPLAAPLEMSMRTLPSASRLRLTT